MKKVLVTGAAGFVGSHLVDQLLEQGKEVTVYDMANIETAMNLQAAKKSPGFRYIQGDIRDREKLTKLFDEKFDVVYHLASIVGVYKYMEDPLGLIDITVGGTRLIGELALKHGTKILYTSTSEVFGKNPKIGWKEDDDRVLGSTQIDRWSYSTSKALCEHMLLALHKKEKLPVTIVRYFNAFGPRQSPIFLVSKNVYNAVKGQAPVIFDGGQQTRCLTYIDDSIRGTIMACEHEKSNGEVFNIGSMTEVTIEQVVKWVVKHTDPKLVPQYLDTDKVYGKYYEDIPRRVPSSEKAFEVLGWKAQVTAEEGIQKSIEWARNNSWWLK